MLGELIDQEGIIVYQGARYKPLPAIAQVRWRPHLCTHTQGINHVSSCHPPAVHADQPGHVHLSVPGLCSWILSASCRLQLVRDGDLGVLAAALGVMDVAYRQEGPRAL